MDKIEGLRTIRNQIKFARHTVITRVLEPHPQRLPTTAPDYQQDVLLIGHATLLMAELDDHAYTLGLLRQDCAHGLAGTTPEGYAELGYEGQPAEGPRPEPYDPYVALGLLLGNAGTAGRLTLSPSLLRYIELMPAQRRRSTVQTQDGEVLLTGDGKGGYRPMTPAEIERVGDQALLATLEETLFVQTYAQDLARVQQLVAQRGDWQQIWDLLQ